MRGTKEPFGYLSGLHLYWELIVYADVWESSLGCIPKIITPGCKLDLNRQKIKAKKEEEMRM